MSNITFYWIIAQRYFWLTASNVTSCTSEQGTFGSWSIRLCFSTWDIANICLVRRPRRGKHLKTHLSTQKWDVSFYCELHGIKQAYIFKTWSLNPGVFNVRKYSVTSFCVRREKLNDWIDSISQTVLVWPSPTVIWSGIKQNSDSNSIVVNRQLNCEICEVRKSTKAQDQSSVFANLRNIKLKTASTPFLVKSGQLR